MGTATAGTVVKASVFTNAFGNAFFAVSVDGQYTLRGATAGEGPIDFGWSLNDYSVAEIAENLVADEMNTRINQIAMEQARRKVRRVGVYSVIGSEEKFSEGNTKRRKLGFTIPDGGNLDLWGRNSSGAQLTTGQVLQVQGTLYGRWT